MAIGLRLPSLGPIGRLTLCLAIIAGPAGSASPALAVSCIPDRIADWTRPDWALFTGTVIARSDTSILVEVAEWYHGPDPRLLVVFTPDSVWARGGNAEDAVPLEVGASYFLSYVDGGSDGCSITAPLDSKRGRRILAEARDLLGDPITFPAEEHAAVTVVMVLIRALRSSFLGGFLSGD